MLLSRASYRGLCAAASSYNTILSEVKPGGVGLITLKRPKALNALNLDMIRSMAAGYEAAVANPAVHCVVLEGAGGKAFCAGGDVKGAALSALMGGARRASQLGDRRASMLGNSEGGAAGEPSAGLAAAVGSFKPRRKVTLSDAAMEQARGSASQTAPLLRRTTLLFRLREARSRRRGPPRSTRSPHRL